MVMLTLTQRLGHSLRFVAIASNTFEDANADIDVKYERAFYCVLSKNASSCCNEVPSGYSDFKFGWYKVG